VLGLDAESGEVDSAGPAFLRAGLRPRLRFIVVLLLLFGGGQTAAEAAGIDRRGKGTRCK